MSDEEQSKIDGRLADPQGPAAGSRSAVAQIIRERFYAPPSDVSMQAVSGAGVLASLTAT